MKLLDLRPVVKFSKIGVIHLALFGVLAAIEHSSARARDATKGYGGISLVIVTSAPVSGLQVVRGQGRSGLLHVHICTS